MHQNYEKVCCVIGNMFDELQEEGIKIIKTKEELNSLLEKENTFLFADKYYSHIFIVGPANFKSEYINEKDVLKILAVADSNMFDSIKTYQYPIEFYFKKDFSSPPYDKIFAATYKDYIYYDKHLINIKENITYLMEISSIFLIDLVIRFSNYIVTIVNGEVVRYNFGEYYKKDSINTYIKLSTKFYEILRKNRIPLFIYVRLMDLLIDNNAEEDLTYMLNLDA